MRKYVPLFIMALLVLMSFGCETDVRTLTRLPTMYDVHATDTEHVWAVGGNGTVLFYDGSSWTPQHGVLAEEGTFPGLYSVHALDDRHVWAVGRGGTILFYDGVEWKEQNGNTGEDLRGICAAAPDRAWAVGSEGTVLFYDGTCWTREESGVSWDLYSVTTFDGRVWASGQNGILRRGEKWQVELELENVASVDAASGYLFAAQSPVVSFGRIPVSTLFRYDGAWNPECSIPEMKVSSISVLGPGDVWATGRPGTADYYDGACWRSTGLTGLDFLGVFALDRDHVWVVGHTIERGFLGTGLLAFYDGSRWRRYLEAL